MTVEELIKELEKWNPQQTVRLACKNYGEVVGVGIKRISYRDLSEGLEAEKTYKDDIIIY
jgi:hypothetical protein